MSKKETYYSEVGVLLKPGDKDFRFYREAVNPKLPYGFYDEDQSVFAEDRLEMELEYVKDYVKDGVEGTYGIIAFGGAVNENSDKYDAIVAGEASIEQYSYYKHASDIRYSVAKIGGEIQEGFLEKIIELSEAKQVDVNVKRLYEFYGKNLSAGPFVEACCTPYGDISYVLREKDEYSPEIELCADGERCDVVSRGGFHVELKGVGRDQECSFLLSDEEVRVAVLGFAPDKAHEDVRIGEEEKGTEQGLDVNDKPVDVLCYGTIQRFETRTEAIEFYLDGMLACEGAEKERYTQVYCELKYTDKPLVSDGSELRKGVVGMAEIGKEAVDDSVNTKNSRKVEDKEL